MDTYRLLLFFLCFTTLVQSQVVPTKPQKIKQPVGDIDRIIDNDTVTRNRFVNVVLSGKTKYTDYKVISYSNDTTYIDTTLSIHKGAIFNYIRKDEFELLPFHNQGQTYSKLGYNFSDNSLLPTIGASAKHYNFYEIEDVNYYQVPTPTTELFYKSGLEQGQVLDALFTFNTSKRHNGSVSFKGLRSLGKYRNTLSSHGNMRFTYSYTSKNAAYNLRSHIVAQDLTNNENGGLTAESLANFENEDPNFSDRGRMDVNFDDASNVLRANRYYLDQGYKLWQYTDTIKSTSSYLKIGHVASYERKHYEFRQASQNALLGDAFTDVTDDKLSHITFDNTGYVTLKSPLVLGEASFKVNYNTYDYGYNGAVFIGNTQIPAALNGSNISVGGNWKTRLKKFNIDAEIGSILSGDFKGNSLKISADFKQDSLLHFRGTLLTNSRSPNLNFLMYQSNYLGYNWFNDLKNERTRSLIFELKSDKILNASAQITQLDNYTYFGDTIGQKQPSPLQADKTVNYLKLKISKEFKFGKFALNNTIMYQNVSQGSAVFRVPEIVTRNTLYFADHLFKGDPLYLQTGVTFKYFSAYKANSYNPLLAEFNIQNAQKIGGYPVFDFFINAQIQRTRLYLKAEHFNSSFTGANYYSAPNYPYRDFVVRFGLVWNFFI